LGGSKNDVPLIGKKFKCTKVNGKHTGFQPKEELLKFVENW